MMQFDKVYSFLMQKLETGLPTYFTYHNVQHTKSVLSAAEYLAAKENVTENDLLILKTAALFHDAGFLQSHLEHEKLSCQLANKILPDFEYSTEQIAQICSLIMATQLPQTPTDHLAQILCDADLFYLGSDDYETNARKLFNEFKKNGTVKTWQEWEMLQVDFLSRHEYFTETAKKENQEKKEQTTKALKSAIASRATHHNKLNTIEILQDAVFIFFGVALASVAINFFLLPNQFIDGGVTGIYLLIQGTHHVSPLFIIPLNLPFIILSYFSVSKRFAFLTFLSIILLGLCMYFFHSVHVSLFSGDKLLMSIFGGVFLGMGIGFVMRAGAALDGIEVLALYTLKRTSFTITEIILGINIIIFAIAAYVFSIETALYSVLTYFAATRTIDYVVEGIRAYTGVTIISGKSEAIKYELVNSLGRGITVYKGERGFLPGKFDVSADCDIIFTVITRLELRKLRNLVYEIDPKAFVFANTIKEAAGGIIKRRNAH